MGKYGRSRLKQVHVPMNGKKHCWKNVVPGIKQQYSTAIAAIS